MRTAQPSRTLHIVVIVLLILLPLMAILQYRWIGEVSEAERERLRASLDRLGVQFATDFDRELTRSLQVFQYRGHLDGADLPGWLSAQLEESARTYNGLVKRVLVARPTDADFELLEFDPGEQAMHRIDWTTELEIYRESLQVRPGRFADRRTPPRWDSTSGTNPIIAIPVTPAPVLGPNGPGPRGPNRGLPPGPPPPMGAILVELDRGIFIHDFVPAIVDRHFPVTHSDYRIAIISRGPKPAFVYKFDVEFTDDDVRTADLTIPLLAGESGRGRGRGGGPPPAFPRGQRESPGPGVRSGAMLTFAWDLVVKHRSGSLDQAIASARQRNLAISFGILLLLAASVALVIASSHRARSLAQLQMDFVARVSHELRTPLAIIRSAAYNLSNGVVTGETDVREYASMVESEGQRLSTMVDQILTFSRTQSGSASYDLRPVEVDHLVDRVLEGLKQAALQSGVKIERDTPPNLPKVTADERALGECLHNLVANAIKYGRSDNALPIRIEAHRSGLNTVVISVGDSGSGIPAADLPHIFEPFFRGRNARSDTPGSGLGLNLVRRLMDAQGGRVTVESEPGQGARFSLHLNIASREMA